MKYLFVLLLIFSTADVLAQPVFGDDVRPEGIVFIPIGLSSSKNIALVGMTLEEIYRRYPDLGLGKEISERDSSFSDAILDFGVPVFRWEFLLPFSVADRPLLCIFSKRNGKCIQTLTESYRGADQTTCYKNMKQLFTKELGVPKEEPDPANAKLPRLSWDTDSCRYMVVAHGNSVRALCIATW